MQKIFKIMLVTLCLLIGITPKKVTAEEPVTSNDTTQITDFSITNAEQEMLEILSKFLFQQRKSMTM